MGDTQDNNEFASAWQTTNATTSGYHLLGISMCQMFTMYYHTRSLRTTTPRRYFFIISILQIRKWAQREVICSRSHSDGRDLNPGWWFLCFFWPHPPCGLQDPKVLSCDHWTTRELPWVVLCKKTRSWSIKALT